MIKENHAGRTPEVQRVYDAGMQLADALRLVGRLEESQDMELWVLGVVGELTEGESKYTDRAELINAIDKFLEEKNHG